MASQSNTTSSARGLCQRRSSTRKLELVEVPCALCGSRSATRASTGFDFEYDTCANEFSFDRCNECGHLYLNPRPSPRDLGIIYPSHYYAFSDEGTSLVARMRRLWEGGKVRMFDELLGKGPKRILDVGCGDGRFLGLLRDFGDEEWSLVGVDFDESAVEQSRARGFEAHATRVEDFEGQDESFDAVIMLQLIEHVEDPTLICERVYSLLKPGGIFIVETPNTAGLDYQSFTGMHWGHYHFPRHWNLFSSESLERMLRKAGFDVVRTDYLISTSAWTISLHNYFLERGYPPWIVRFFHYKNPLLLGIFVLLDSLRARLGGQTSNQRMIGRKPRN